VFFNDGKMQKQQLKRLISKAVWLDKTKQLEYMIKLYRDALAESKEKCSATQRKYREEFILKEIWIGKITFCTSYLNKAHFAISTDLLRS